MNPRTPLPCRKPPPTAEPARRGAFTLVELLVVIILIAILAGLAAAFLPAIGDSARAAQGATMVQQWIQIARQKALRDQVPCGIRLLPYVDPATKKPVIYFSSQGARPAQVRQCQFIEQPDDLTVSPTTTGNVGYLMTENPPPPGAPPHLVVYISGATLQLNQRAANGDYLEILGSGLMYKINSIGPPQANSNSPMPKDITTEIALYSLPLYPIASTVVPGVPTPISGTRQWRIVRAPRVTGDDILQLPDGVVIDIKTNDVYGNPLPINPTSGSIDILFSPSGAVITPGYTSDSINLWVREFNANPAPNPLPPSPSVLDADPNHGDQTIIAVYVRSGLTAAHPPAPQPGSPYAFILDGRTSGK